MGFPSYLESISERLVESLTRFSNSEAERVQIQPISLDEIRRVVEGVVNQVIPQSFMKHYENPALENELFYKRKYEIAEAEAKSFEFKLEKQSAKNRLLIAQCEDLNMQIEKLREQELTFRGDAHSLLAENAKLRTTCSQFEESLRTATSHFEDKIKQKDAAFDKQIRAVRAQAVQDISEWDKFTSAVPPRR